MLFAGTTTYSIAAQDMVKPVISYILSVDTADLSGYTIKLSIKHAPANVTLAMATHHEYDDRFWRYVENFTARRGPVTLEYVHMKNAVWQIKSTGDSINVSYRIRLPLAYPYHPCHRPFLASYGGLIGDIHSFMYLVDYENLPVSVTFQLPGGWQIATGLTATSRYNVFTAANFKVLLDCPVFAGKLRTWNFVEGGIPYKIVYLPSPGAAYFDTSLLITNIKKITHQAVNFFGAVPYHNYTFLLRDSTYGALEHINSVTIGASSSMLAVNMQELYEELAHEFFHTWNLLSIRPAEYTDLNYDPQQQSAGLWFSEGLSMFYADLLVRRAGLPVEDSTRAGHLRALVQRYFQDTGNTFIPPGKVSLASNAQPGMLGDYNASTHLQGELIGTMIDMITRSSTGGKKTMDNVMRMMYTRYGYGKGFYPTDIENAVHDVCACDVHGFFEKYVYQGCELDFNKYLDLIGMKVVVRYTPAKNNKNLPAPDTRVYIFRRPEDSLYRIALTTPNSCWGHAGLHTGDVILAINNQPLKSPANFYKILQQMAIGDTVHINILRQAIVKTANVIITGYQTPVVSIVPLDKINAKQKDFFRNWEKGN